MYSLISFFREDELDPESQKVQLTYQSFVINKCVLKQDSMNFKYLRQI